MFLEGECVLIPGLECYVHPGFSNPPRECQGDGSWPLSGISSACHSHGPCFQHFGGFCASGGQGQISSPVVLQRGVSRHRFSEMIPVIRTSHSWDASAISQLCQWLFLLKRSSTLFLRWSFLDFSPLGLSCLWTKGIASSVSHVIHLTGGDREICQGLRQSVGFK